MNDSLTLEVVHPFHNISSVEKELTGESDEIPLGVEVAIQTAFLDEFHDDHGPVLIVAIQTNG